MQDFKHLRDPYDYKNRDTARRYYDDVLTENIRVRRESRKAIVSIIVLMLLLAVALRFAPERVDVPSGEYCEMTALFVSSDGEFGWPDFNNNMHRCVQGEGL